MLKIIDLHKSYSDGTREVTVLKGLNLQIKAGEFVSVVGPSGAGKSTLLHIAGALDTPTKGEVVFEGNHFSKLNDKALARLRNERIGFIFQFYHLMSEFTVLENCLMPALIAPPKSGIRVKRQEVRDLLERVGLAERLNFFPAQLSGGERQRVAIVRALINKPALLLCDEPTGNLDSKTGAGIFELLTQINRQEKAAVVMVTHNQELASRTDRVFYMRDGLLVN